MVKKSIGFLLALVLVLTMMFSGCTRKLDMDKTNKDETNSDEAVVPGFYRKVAREMTEDGWVFSFVSEGDKDTETDDDLHLYFGINLRYQYKEGYIETISQETSRGTIYQTYAPGILIFGKGSEAQKRDRAILDDLLHTGKTVEELLALNPEDYTFEELDGEMFFRLMRTALTGEPQKEATKQSYWDKPRYAMLVEPTYVDGYKFQVAFLQETGCVDELYIDVLYQTGEEYDAYVQLSDMVDDGTATQEQQEAFAKIRAIVEEIKEAEDYTSGAESYRNMVLGGIDFSRLYTFLYNIHINNYNMYIADPVILDSEGNEAS